jgi:hypothetical protein
MGPETILDECERKAMTQSNHSHVPVNKERSRFLELLAKPTVLVAIITVAGAILVALIQYQPWQHRGDQPIALHVAGTIVDSDTNQGIGQAQITLSGRTENYWTEDNGNFRIDIMGNADEARRLRIRVNKKGYRTYDQSVTPPLDTLIIPLQKP